MEPKLFRFNKKYNFQCRKTMFLKGGQCISEVALTPIITIFVFQATAQLKNTFK